MKINKRKSNDNELLIRPEVLALLYGTGKLWLIYFGDCRYSGFKLSCDWGHKPARQPQARPKWWAQYALCEEFREIIQANNFKMPGKKKGKKGKKGKSREKSNAGTAVSDTTTALTSRPENFMPLPRPGEKVCTTRSITPPRGGGGGVLPMWWVIHMCRGFDPLFSLWQDRARSFWGIFLIHQQQSYLLGYKNYQFLQKSIFLAPNSIFSSIFLGPIFSGQRHTPISFQAESPPPGSHPNS